MALCRVPLSRMFDAVSIHEVYYALQHEPRKSFDTDTIRLFTAQWPVFSNLPRDVHRTVCEGARFISLAKGTIICHKVDRYFLCKQLSVRMCGMCVRARVCVFVCLSVCVCKHVCVCVCWNLILSHCLLTL